MSKKYEWLGKYNNIVESYRSESDRAAAIFAASFLENRLGEMLRQFLVAHKDVDNSFEPYKPLSTFSSIIDISFALGLLTKEMKSDSTLIRKIRNHFAHHPEHVGFKDEPVKGYCSSLTTAKVDNSLKGNKLILTKPKDQYLFAMVISVIHYDRFIEAEKQRKIPKKVLSS